MKTLRIGPVGVVTQRRTLVVGLALLATVVALIVVSLAVGRSGVGVLDSLRAAVGIPVGPPADFIIGQVRAPRVLTTALVGAMLGLAGAILQFLTRNPLASPDFIGISAGAGAGAVLTIATAAGTSIWVTAAGAAAGAVTAAVLIIGLSWRRGIVPLRLILAGIGIGFAAQATTQFLLTQMQIYQAGDALVWLVGSTASRTWTHVALAAGALALLGSIALGHARALRTLEMGDDTARALGIAVTRSRLVLTACAVLLAAAATAVVGPIAFIALVAPAIAVRLARGAGMTLIPSALMGAALLLTADLVAQHATGALQLPVGIYTAAVGAPYLLYLVWRASRGGPA